MIALLLIAAAATNYIVVQTLDGRHVHLNTAHIVSVVAGAEGGNKLMTGAASCLINLLDKRFLTVAETCDSIRKRMEGMR